MPAPAQLLLAVAAVSVLLSNYMAVSPPLVAASANTPPHATPSTSASSSSATSTLDTSTPDSRSAQQSKQSPSSHFPKVNIFKDLYDMGPTMSSMVMMGRSGILEVDAEQVIKESRDAIIMADPLTRIKYLCRTPNFEQELTFDEEEPLDKEMIYMRNAKAVELLKGLEASCMTYQSTWWQYQYCHNKEIRQTSDFPLALKAKPLKYLLGKYSKKAPGHAFMGDRETAADAGAELVVDDADGIQYLRMWYGYGDKCNGNPRVVEARFHCCKNEHISLVQEVAVCNYIFTIHTPRACVDGLFRPVKIRQDILEVVAPKIRCEPIVVAQFGEAGEPATTPPLQPVDIVDPIHPLRPPSRVKSHKSIGTAASGTSTQTAKPLYVPSPLPLVDFLRSDCQKSPKSCNLLRPPRTALNRQSALKNRFRGGGGSTSSKSKFPHGTLFPSDRRHFWASEDDEDDARWDTPRAVSLKDKLVQSLLTSEEEAMVAKDPLIELEMQIQDAIAMEEQLAEMGTSLKAIVEEGTEVGELDVEALPGAPPPEPALAGPVPIRSPDDDDEDDDKEDDDDEDDEEADSEELEENSADKKGPDYVAGGNGDRGTGEDKFELDDIDLILLRLEQVQAAQMAGDGEVDEEEIRELEAELLLQFGGNFELDENGDVVLIGEGIPAMGEEGDDDGLVGDGGLEDLHNDHGGVVDGVE